MIYFCRVYQNVLKPLFFWMTPERAHYAAMDLFVLASRIPGVSWWFRRKVRQQNEGQEVEVAGLKFPNKVGLAAGFDKDAKWLDALALLGCVTATAPAAAWAWHTLLWLDLCNLATCSVWLMT